MASTGVTVRVVSNRLPQMPAQIKAAVSAEVGKAGFSVESKAKEKVPKKTRTLMRSIHTVGPSGQPWKLGDMAAIIGPSVLYGAFVEFGTRRMGARPYLRPAYAAVIPGFAAAIKAALRGLK